MKNPDINDLLILLVSAGWAERDIVTVLMMTSKLNLIDLENDLREISYRLEEIQRSTRTVEKHQLRFHGLSKKESPPYNYSDLYLKVKNMLVFELGLTTPEIVHLLSAELGDKKHVPPLSKKSLENWLERLSSYYSPSEILHAAAVIRDQFNKKKSMDWGIRDETK